MARRKRWPGYFIVLFLLLSGYHALYLALPEAIGHVTGGDTTRADLPVVFNGTIPTAYVYEDNESSGKDLLDLKMYVWDPDGHGLMFTDATPVHYDEWGPDWDIQIDKGVVSFSPMNANSSGPVIFKVRAQGPGQDNIWSNTDDPNVVFNVSLIVLPVNDGAPVLEYILVGDQRIEPSLFSLVSFKVGPNEEWSCHLVYSDPDDDTIAVSIMDPSGSSSFSEDWLTFNSSKKGSFHIGIVLNDTWVNSTYHIDLIVEGRVPIPTFLGISFDGIGVDIPVVDGSVNISFFEDEEVFFLLVFDLPGEYSFTDVGDYPFPFEVFDLVGSLGPYSVPHWGENVSTIIGWSEANGTKGTFGLNVQIMDVNERPEIISIYSPGNHFTGEGSIFYLNFRDSDMDICWYLIDFGDGTPRVNGSASWIEHNYTERGNYSVSISLFDGYGGQDFSWTSVHIKDRTEQITVVPDDTVKIEWTECGLVIFGAIVTVLILVIILRVRKRPEAHVEE